VQVFTEVTDQVRPARLYLLSYMHFFALTLRVSLV